MTEWLLRQPWWTLAQGLLHMRNLLEHPRRIRATWRIHSKGHGAQAVLERGLLSTQPAPGPGGGQRFYGWRVLEHEGEAVVQRKPDRQLIRLGILVFAS